ncbi:MAG: hypothetical protein HN831_06665, partial [Waddliaceae bacterium]|nr:hypothetical protein [Waddliaceae bacterium]
STEAGTFNHTGSLQLGSAVGSTSIFPAGMTHITGATTLWNSLTSTNTAISLGALTLASAAEVNSDTGAGDITFSGTVNGAYAFTANAGAGSIITSGEIGGSAEPAAISFTSETIALGGDINGSSTILLQPYADATAININNVDTAYALSTTEIGYLQDGFTGITIGRSGGSHEVTIGAITFYDPVTIRTGSVGEDVGYIHVDGEITGAGDASVTLQHANPSTTTLNANIVTEGNFIYIDDDVLVGDTVSVTLDTTSGIGNAAGAAITITGTTNSVASEINSLTLNAGTEGTITFEDSVGVTDALATLTITNSNGTTFSGSVEAATIEITDTEDGETILFQDDVTITAGLTTTDNAYNMSFIGDTTTIQGPTTFYNTGTLILGDSPSDIIILTGGVNFEDGPSSVSLVGTITAVDSSITFEDITLAGDLALDVGDGDIGLNGTISAANYNITLTANSITTDADSVVIANSLTFTTQAGIGSDTALRTRTPSFTAENTGSGDIWIRNNTTAGQSAALTIPAGGVTNSGGAIRIEQGNLTFNNEKLSSSDSTTGGNLVLTGAVDASSTVKLHVMGGITGNTSLGNDVIGVGTCEMLAFNGAIGNYNGQPGTDGYTPIEVNITGNMYVYASRESEPIGVAVDGNVINEEVLSGYDEYVSEGLMLFNGRIQGGERMLDFHRARLAKWFKSSSPRTALKSNDPTLFGSDVIRSLLEDEWFAPVTDFLVEGSEYENVYVYETVSYEDELDGIDNDRTIEDIETFYAYDNAEEVLMPLSEDENMKDAEEYLEELLQEISTESDIKIYAYSEKTRGKEKDGLLASILNFWARECEKLTSQRWFTKLFKPRTKDDIEKIVDEFIEDYESVVDDIVESEAVEGFLETSEEVAEELKDKAEDWFDIAIEFLREEDEDFATYPQTDVLDDSIDDYAAISRDIIDRGTDKTIEVVEDILETSEEFIEEFLVTSKEVAEDFLETSEEVIEEFLVTSKEASEELLEASEEVIEELLATSKEVAEDLLEISEEVVEGLKGKAEDWFDTTVEFLREEDEDFATYPQIDVLDDSIDDYAAISRDIIDRG